MNLKRNVPLCALVVLISGCATITSDSTQPLAVTARMEDGTLVEKASCSLKNDKGSWSVETPGVVAVHRSAEDIIVECKKEGVPEGIARGISRAAGGMWGNIIFGGGIGAIVDHSKGTGYNYPDDLPVVMGSSVVVDRANEKKNREKQDLEKQTPSQGQATNKN